MTSTEFPSTFKKIGQRSDFFLPKLILTREPILLPGSRIRRILISSNSVTRWWDEQYVQVQAIYEVNELVLLLDNLAIVQFGILLILDFCWVYEMT